MGKINFIRHARKRANDYRQSPPTLRETVAVYNAITAMARANNISFEDAVRAINEATFDNPHYNRYA